MIASELQEEINRSNARNKISVKVVLFLFAAIVVASSCFGYWQYNQDYRSPGFSSAPRGWMAVVNGTAYAPQQYRIGVVLPAYWIARHTTLKISFVLALFDLVSGFVTVFLLYDLLQKSETYRRASATAQWFGVAAFALLMQYDVVWIQRYQRPETFPVAMLTASLFWIWTPPKHRQLKSSMERWGRVGGVLVVSLLLGLMRADTGFTLNAGALLVCILQPRKTLSWPRWLALAISLAGCLLSAGAQIYIMRVVYPQANYGDCAYSELRLNLQDPMRWLPFLLLMIPYGWTLVQLAQRRRATASANLALAAGSILFTGLWFLLGKIDEVRIFIPFALTLTPLTVQFLMRRLERASLLEQATASDLL